MAECDAAALSHWEARLGPGGLRRVIATLLADAPRLLGLLRDSVARGDAHELVFAAHSLKTPCAMFGSSGLAGLCQELEDQGAAGAMAGAAGKAAVLDARFEALIRELELRP
ncbi:MAG: Hpt domain-containing protein [Hydrocarboniphaga effusa]|nr:Hpt domain-containing protein [Hydrocarboniphaga effusa]